VSVSPEQASVVSIDQLRRSAKPINEELSYAEWLVGDRYRTGYIRFVPRPQRESTMILHQDQDVICLVLAGRGQLRRGERSVTLHPGLLCRIPAGTPHDFSAGTETLELFYTTVQVREQPTEPH
jgi:mannose-6-phosphate isomerase-like protein (cupin superfamily)